MSSGAFQGAGALTEQKVIGVQGIVHTRLTMRKFKAGEVTIVADVFSGDGVNEISEDEVVNGTPIAVINGYLLSRNRGNAAKSEIRIVATDIRPSAIERLRATVRNMFPSLNERKLTFACAVREAAEQIKALHQSLRKNPLRRLILILDPNGPKDFPFAEVEAVSTDPMVKDRVDIVIHISATSMKRVIGLAKKGTYRLDWWDAAIQHLGKDFLLKLAAGRPGWIRKMTPGDPWQWLVIAFFSGTPPKNDWERKGYVQIESDEGRNEIERYSAFSGKKQ